MREIRAVVADDEPLARRGIRQLLERHRDVRLLAEARDGRETLRALSEHHPDLLFLDVQMPELDGFDVLRLHGVARMPAVVFVTAYDAFALKAFDAHALDYLVKPVQEARFAEALSRVRARLRAGDAQALARRLEALLELREAEAARQRLLVPTAFGQLVLGVDEIDWIEAEDYYAAVHACGRRHLIRESLASLEQRLRAANGSRFVRAHRSALVNAERVRELRADGAGETALVLRDGTRIPVSRRRREQVQATLRRLGAPPLAAREAPLAE